MTNLYDRYDFDSFLTKAMKLQLHEILVAAERECAAAESASYGKKGAVSARAAGSTRYAHELKELLFWLQNRKRPGTVSNDNWAQIRVLARHLVEIGDLKPEALKEWS